MREDWIECKLEQISTGKNGIVDGPFGSNLKTSDYVKKGNGTVPVLTTKNLQGNYDDDSVRFISQEKFLELKRSQVVPNDIIVAKIGSIGKNGIYPFNSPIAIIPANLLKFTVNDLVVLKYVHYFIKTYAFQATLKRISTATAQPAFNVTKFRNLNIPLPPLPEQRGIVKKLESLFSSLDVGVADLKKAQQQLKIYRQAVLKKAFEGEFVEVKFKELGDAIDPQPSHRTPPVDANGIPYVSIKDIVGNKLELSKARLVSKNVLQEHLNRYTILENDFIIGKIGTIGNPVKVHLPQNYTLSANVVLIQPRKINSNYLYYYFKSSNIEQQFNSGKKATTQAAFGIQKVRDLIIRYPLDDSQQRKIVLDIETKLSVCDSIEQNIKESLAKAEALRQSILKKAFEGNLLTAQELAECKQAVDYEPASVLLERIKAEQNKATPKHRKKK